MSDTTAPTPAAGFFVDWDSNLRSVDDPGGGYRCEVDHGARYVGVFSRDGALAHEATLYRTLEAVERAGIKARLVPGSQPWGRPRDGF
ncbi:hypothetical protein C7444_11466 [Sphaerotilus hippei]|uniref:Uncharacterized protein n=1 Tax=Sphaerotilus hippei TaxID=744406 RepID=A0A318H5D0_9BURK|nr:hypothetical protein [Sphaerotilus hippei]PXW94367.1 hypothetical protein C7444_11466 [Sphaerotilus hippei]